MKFVALYGCATTKIMKNKFVVYLILNFLSDGVKQKGRVSPQYIVDHSRTVDLL